MIRVLICDDELMALLPDDIPGPTEGPKHEPSKAGL